MQVLSVGCAQSAHIEHNQVSKYAVTPLYRLIERWPVLRQVSRAACALKSVVQEGSSGKREKLPTAESIQASHCCRRHGVRSPNRGTVADLAARRSRLPRPADSFLALPHSGTTYEGR